MEPYSNEAAGDSALMISSGRIDVHAHFVPPEWHELPAAGSPLLRGFASWSVPSALEMMDRQGVAATVLTTALWAGLFNDARDASAAHRFARSSNEVAAEAIRRPSQPFRRLRQRPAARRGRRAG